METPLADATRQQRAALIAEADALLADARGLRAEVQEHSRLIGSAAGEFGLRQRGGGCLFSSEAGAPAELTDEPFLDVANPSGSGGEELQLARLQHLERLRELGVSEDALGKVAMSGLDALVTKAGSPPMIRRLDPPPASRLRVMQWNVLADGLSDDGFLVEDILSVQAGEAMLTSPAKMLAASAPLEALAECVREPAAAQRAEQNLRAVIDWQARYARMLTVVQMIEPDVITLQELDHMAEAQRDLGSLGYECSLDSTPYRPMHALAVAATDTAGYLRTLAAAKVAFAPKFPSKCRKLQLGRGRPDADDMGVAVFWRRERFQALAIDFRPLACADSATPPQTQEAVIRVKLCRRADGTPISVLCSHLASGDKDTDEAERVVQVNGSSAPALPGSGLPPPPGGLPPPGGPLLPGGGGGGDGGGLREWFMESAGEGAAVLLCMDANSAPTRSEPTTVWTSLRGTCGVRSVWDEYFSPAGERLPSADAPFPVTTNKMRGPLSQQKKKVGEHMLHVIDHIFWLGEGLSRPRHAWGPTLFSTAAASHAHLLPSLQCPSDHLPVIVDFDLALSDARRPSP